MKATPRLNYDQIAIEFNQRYTSGTLPERTRALLSLVRQHRPQRILEVGSGTGVWLNFLSAHVASSHGLDYSRGMLKQAQNQLADLKLSRGEAIRLPYRSDAFDLVYSVDAIHHFGDQRAFIREAFRILRPAGLLAVIGHDPHDEQNAWYAYDYFDGVLATDLQRYPSDDLLIKLMQAEGFDDARAEEAEHILSVHSGRKVFDDPYLGKNSSSQLALLSDRAYQAGIEKIERAIAGNSQQVLRTDLRVKMFTGTKPA